MNDAKKFETKMEVPSAKTHSVLRPFGFVLRTFRWHTFDSALRLTWIASRYGLPVVPEWAPWFTRELNQRKAIRPLTGLGCSPVLVSGNKPTFLKWIGKALREGLIHIPKENGSITWKLPTNFLAPSAPEIEMSVRVAT